MSNRSYKDSVPDGYERIISNGTGVVDIKPWRGGLWVIIEDGLDCCSIGLQADEVQELVSHLLMSLVKNTPAI